MKQNNYSLLLLSSLVVVACADDSIDVRDTDVAADIVEVCLNVGVSTVDMGTATRATSPLTPDMENLIYDLWVVQFTKGANFSSLVANTVQHLRTDATGVISVSGLTVSLLAQDSYVCVIANRNPGNATTSLAALYDADDDITQYETFEGFQTALVSLDLESLNDGNSSTVKKMLMCGVWEGTPSARQTLNVTLGRMMSRLNVSIANNTGAKKKLNVTLRNAARQSYLYPSVPAWGKDTLPQDAYMDLPADEVTVASGATCDFYYYTAPNFCGVGYPTELYIRDVTSKKSTGTATVSLGNDAPGVSNRNLNLYPNTIYNYTITVGVE